MVERGGGYSIELFIVNDDGSMALLNSADSMARTYRSAAAIGGALAREFLPRPNSVADIEDSILVELVGGEWPVDPNPVTLSLNGTTDGGRREPFRRGNLDPLPADDALPKKNCS